MKHYTPLKFLKILAKASDFDSSCFLGFLTCWLSLNKLFFNMIVFEPQTGCWCGYV